MRNENKTTNAKTIIFNSLSYVRRRFRGPLCAEFGQLTLRIASRPEVFGCGGPRKEKSEMNDTHILGISCAALNGRFFCFLSADHGGPAYRRADCGAARALVSARTASIRRSQAGKFNRANLTAIGGKEAPKFYPWTWAQRDKFMASGTPEALAIILRNQKQTV